MATAQHYRGLESAHASAPINDFYQPEIQIAEGTCTASITLEEKFFHSLGAAHGSVYFKLLDDSAFFACMSLEEKHMVLTTSFTTYLTRPISQGVMTAIGKVVNQNNSQYIAESVVYDEQDREVGRGNGIFTKTKIAIDTLAGYQR